MKQYRTIIILAAAAIILAGVWFWLDHTDDAAISGYLYNLEEGEEITSIALSNSFGSYDFSMGEDGRWQVEHDGSVYRTHRKKMDLMVSALQQLQISRVLEDDNPDYGLERPSAIVTCATNQGRTYAFAVGNETPSRSEVYIRDGETGKVMVTSTGAVAQYTGSLVSYRDKEVFTVDKNNLLAIDYYKDGEKVISLDSSSSQWNITYPFEAPARQIAMGEFLKDWQTWTVAGFPEDDVHNYAAMGLEEPTEWFEFTDVYGSTQRLEIGRQDGTGTYVRSGGRDEIAIMYTADLDFSGFNPDGLVFVAPLKTSVDQLSSISVQTAGRSEVFEIEQLENGKQRITSDGTEINFNDFSSVFSKYIGLNADGYAPGTPAGSEPAAVITNTFTDGTEVQLVLMPRDDTTLYMVVDGKTDFFLEVSELQELLYRIDKVKGRV